MLFGVNLNGAEYEARTRKPFSPPTLTLKEIHDAVPKHLLKCDPFKSAAYVARDITFTLLLFKLASLIGPWAATDFSGYVTSTWTKSLLQAALWATYYWVQGLVWAGLFVLGKIYCQSTSIASEFIIGHEAGHGTLFNDDRVNNAVGFAVHT
ncbi:hypothetical protein H0H93_013124, partial [Arthromyces matolae]